jgi:Na+/phosphate symporter
MGVLPRRASRILFVLAGIASFLLALDAIKTSARALDPIFDGLAVRGRAGALGFGWILACVFLSGSPSAAVALGFLAGGVLSPGETLAMITGSRIGASFVILALGVVYDLRGRRHGSVYVGAATLLATATIYVPASALALALLSGGFLEGLRLDRLPGVASILDVTIHPIVAAADAALPSGLLLLLGVGCLLVSFKLLDRALPDPTHAQGRLAGIAERVWRPSVVCAVGMVVTALTLSVSLSISLLVPLTAKGYVRRENLIPYILGANITTFIDTLVASLLVGHAAAFPVVASLVLAVSATTLLAFTLFYRSYAGWIDRTAHAWTATRRRQAILAAALFAVPLALLLAG